MVGELGWVSCGGRVGVGELGWVSCGGRVGVGELWWVGEWVVVGGFSECFVGCSEALWSVVRDQAHVTIMNAHPFGSFLLAAQQQSGGGGTHHSSFIQRIN